MIPTVLEADLGRLHAPRRHPKEDVRHRLLFVAEVDAVVMPYCIAGGAWLCLIVAARETGPDRPDHVALTEQQLAAASDRLVIDPTDHDGLALLLWPARVFLRWPGGTFPALARVLVEELRVPGTVHVPAAAVANHGRLASRLPNVRPPAIKVMFSRLAASGLLAVDLGGGGYTIRVPEPRKDQAAT